MHKQPLIIFNKWRIREAAQYRRLTMTRIQGYLNTCPPTFYKWLENGFDRDVAEKLAGLLGYSIAQLCERLDHD